MAQQNIFSGIAFPSGQQLETDVNKLNVYKGAIDSLGGIIKGYQEKEEQNKFSNFNKALTNFQREGDVEAIKALTDYSTEFTDPKLREQALNSSTGAFDNTALNIFNQSLQKAQQTGDFTGLSVPTTFDPNKAQMASKSLTEASTKNTLGNIDLAIARANASRQPADAQIAIDLVNSVNLPNTERAKALNLVAPLKVGLELDSLVTAGTKEFNANINNALQANVGIVQKLLQDNPQYTSVVGIDNGLISFKDPTSDEVNALVKRNFPTLKEDSPEYKRASAEVSQNLIKERSALVTDLLNKAYASGARPAANIGIDPIITKFRALAAEKNLPPAETEATLAKLTSILQSNQSLGVEAQGKLSATLESINAKKNNDLAQLKDIKELTSKYQGKLDTQVIENLSKTEDDVWKEIDSFSNSGMLAFSSQEGRNSIKEAVTKLMQENFTAANNTQRKPTASEVLSAIREQSSSSIFANKSMDTSGLKDAIQRKVSANKSFDTALATEEGRKLINSHYADVNKVESKAQEDAIKARLSFSGSTPKGSIERFNRELEKISKVNAIESKPTLNPNVSTVPFDTLFNKLIQSESSGKHTDSSGNLTKSKSGALGITQLMPDTANNPGYGITPLPKNATKEDYIRVGKEYLQAMLTKYDNNQQLALAAYNAGPGNVDKAIEKAKSSGGSWEQYLPKPEETIPYINSILGTNIVNNTNKPTAQEVVAKLKPSTVETPVTPKKLTEFGDQALTGVLKAIPSSALATDRELTTGESSKVKKTIQEVIGSLKMSNTNKPILSPRQSGYYSQAKSPTNIELIKDLEDIVKDDKVSLTKVKEMLKGYKSN